MSVTIRVERGRLVYDINVKTPQGHVRERANLPKEIKSQSGGKRWAEARALELAKNGKKPEAKVAPTFKDFGDRWLKEYARAEGLKPSTQDTYKRILRLHLSSLDSKRLNEIEAPEVQRVKLALEGRTAKTRACVLSLLAEVLKAAVEWGELEKMPKIEKPRWMNSEMAFYDFAEWERLVEGGRRAGPMVLCGLLLGGDAGLRRGEIVAFEQADCGGGSLLVQRSEWEGEVGTPKGGKSRRIPLTSRLQEAIAAVRHLRGKRLLWQANGDPVGVPTLQSWLEVACRRAGLPESRNLHKLRHTFCSHLAMKGVPVTAIKEWAGHADLKTTMRYMHLSPGGMDSMIHVLEDGAGVEQGKAEGRT